MGRPRPLPLPADLAKARAAPLRPPGFRPHTHFSTHHIRDVFTRYPTIWLSAQSAKISSTRFNQGSEVGYAYVLVSRLLLSTRTFALGKSRVFQLFCNRIG